MGVCFGGCEFVTYSWLHTVVSGTLVQSILRLSPPPTLQLCPPPPTMQTIAGQARTGPVCEPPFFRIFSFSMTRVDIVLSFQSVLLYYLYFCYLQSLLLFGFCFPRYDRRYRFTRVLLPLYPVSWAEVCNRFAPVRRFSTLPVFNTLCPLFFNG